MGAGRFTTRGGKLQLVVGDDDDSEDPQPARSSVKRPRRRSRLIQVRVDEALYQNLQQRSQRYGGLPAVNRTLLRLFSRGALDDKLKEYAQLLEQEVLRANRRTTVQAAADTGAPKAHSPQVSSKRGTRSSPA